MSAKHNCELGCDEDVTSALFPLPVRQSSSPNYWTGNYVSLFFSCVCLTAQFALFRSVNYHVQLCFPCVWTFKASRTRHSLFGHCHTDDLSACLPVCFPVCFFTITSSMFILIATRLARVESNQRWDWESVTFVLWFVLWSCGTPSGQPVVFWVCFVVFWIYIKTRTAMDIPSVIMTEQRLQSVS